MSLSLKPPEIWECVFCQFEDCPENKTPIPLPSPTPPPIEQHLGWWPNGSAWLFVGCPECRRISALLTSQPVHFLDSRSRPHADKFWLRISFRCAVEGCNTPVQFHVLEEPTISPTTKDEWHEKLSSGYWKGACPNGHRIATTTEQKIVFESMPGRLLGYDPAHRDWKIF